MRLICKYEEIPLKLSARHAPLFATIYIDLKKAKEEPVHLVLEYREVLCLLEGMEAALKEQCVHFQNLLHETQVAIGSAERIIASAPEGVPL